MLSGLYEASQGLIRLVTSKGYPWVVTQVLLLNGGKAILMICLFYIQVVLVSPLLRVNLMFVVVRLISLRLALLPKGIHR